MYESLPASWKNGVIATTKGTTHEVNNKLLQFSLKLNEHILFVSSDLILAKGNYGGLMIYNALTRQSSSLPSPPDHHYGTFVGCLRSKDDPMQYKVVLVQLPKQYNIRSSSNSFLHIYVFSSKNDDWSKFLVLAPPNMAFREIYWEHRSQYTTVCNGILYWTNNMIVGYDPFNKPNESEFIDFLDQCGIDMDCACITNVQGCIRFYDRRMTSTSTMSFWDLTDYPNRVWTKKVVDLSGIQWHNISSAQPKSIKGFNPFCEDVYVLLSNDSTLAINLESKTEKVNTNFKSSSAQIIADFRLKSEIQSRMFPFAPPSWPMPL